MGGALLELRSQCTVGRRRNFQEELPVAALVVVAMVQGHGGPVGPSEFDNGYLRAHLVQVLDLMGRSLADWSSTLMVMRDWLSL